MYLEADKRVNFQKPCSNCSAKPVSKNQEVTCGSGIQLQPFMNGRSYLLEGKKKMAAHGESQKPYYRSYMQRLKGQDALDSKLACESGQACIISELACRTSHSHSLFIHISSWWTRASSMLQTDRSRMTRGHSDRCA